MNEQRKKWTQPVKKRLTKEALEVIIKKTITTPVGKGFISRCYCKRCGLSWDMRAGGLRILRKENSADAFKTPAEVGNLENEEELKRCYFILEPCFACRINGEKIQTEAHLIPSQLALKNGVTRFKTLAPNKKRNKP